MELQLLPTHNMGGCNVITKYYSLIVANAETSILAVVIVYANDDVKFLKYFHSRLLNHVRSDCKFFQVCRLAKSNLDSQNRKVLINKICIWSLALGYQMYQIKTSCPMKTLANGN